ncbi:MAG: hypothetical protein JNM14_16345 [Ferruginibacter sp.]|nr:hypothetical protein [Ferruginibacter sp.]
MKRKIKKWTFRLAVTGLFIAGLLLVIILNPVLTYANKTEHNNHTLFHNKPLDPAVLTTLDQAAELLKASEFYNPKLRLDICLNDGSKYPELIKALRGQAFAWGFYNKVIMQGNADFKKGYVKLNGYKWNLTQLLAHEMTHCLQFDELGFWKSKPIANIPNWKWEGYAEYVSRQNDDQKNLFKNITRLIGANKNSWEIIFADNTIAPRAYYEYWILVQYCMDIKKMTYKQMLADTKGEQAVKEEMMRWFYTQR